MLLPPLPVFFYCVGARTSALQCTTLACVSFVQSTTKSQLWIRTAYRVGKGNFFRAQHHDSEALLLKTNWFLLSATNYKPFAVPFSQNGTALRTTVVPVCEYTSDYSQCCTVGIKLASKLWAWLTSWLELGPNVIGGNDSSTVKVCVPLDSLSFEYCQCWAKIWRRAQLVVPFHQKWFRVVSGWFRECYKKIPSVHRRDIDQLILFSTKFSFCCRHHSSGHRYSSSGATRVNKKHSESGQSTGCHMALLPGTAMAHCCCTGPVKARTHGLSALRKCVLGEKSLLCAVVFRAQFWNALEGYLFWMVWYKMELIYYFSTWAARSCKIISQTDLVLRGAAGWLR